jgi:hypothetical protein
MSPEANSKQEQLRQLVSSTLRRAETRTANLHRTHMSLVVGGLVTSAASTLVAGGAALQGPLLGPGAAGWQLTCGLAAVLGFISTICLGIEQQLKLGERLPAGRNHVGRLRALDVALTTGTRDWDEIAKEIELVIRESAGIFG